MLAASLLSGIVTGQVPCNNRAAYPTLPARWLVSYEQCACLSIPQRLPVCSPAHRFAACSIHADGLECPQTGTSVSFCSDSTPIGGKCYASACSDETSTCCRRYSSGGCQPSYFMYVRVESDFVVPDSPPQLPPQFPPPTSPPPPSPPPTIPIGASQPQCNAASSNSAAEWLVSYQQCARRSQAAQKPRPCSCAGALAELIAAPLHPAAQTGWSAHKRAPVAYSDAVHQRPSATSATTASAPSSPPRAVGARTRAHARGRSTFSTCESTRTSLSRLPLRRNLHRSPNRRRRSRYRRHRPCRAHRRSRSRRRRWGPAPRGRSATWTPIWRSLGSDLSSWSPTSRCALPLARPRA